MESAVDRARVQVISDRMAPDGTLAWTPPAPGSWTVLRFMMVARRSGNHPVNPEAHGLECDKLSRAGVDAALGGMMTRIMDDARQTGMKAFKYTLVDSYEVGAQNWTDGMEKTFRARRAEDVAPYHGYARHHVCVCGRGRRPRRPACPMTFSMAYSCARRAGDVAPYHGYGWRAAPRVCTW